MNFADAATRAVLSEACTLPLGCRFFVVALAQLADWRTGRGIAGQGRLARAMGCDVRTVKRLKKQLQEAADSPVSVEWRHRSRADGLNGSDAYQLVMRAEVGGHKAGQVTVLQGQVTEMQGTGDNLPYQYHHRVTPGDTLGIKKPKNVKSLGLNDPDSKLPGRQQQLTADQLRLNGFHLKAAEQVGLTASIAAAEWIKLHTARRTLFDSQQHLQASFGGWLKRQVAVEPEEPPAADEPQEAQPPFRRKRRAAAVITDG